MDGVTAAEARSLGRKKQKQNQNKTQSICRAMLPWHLEGILSSWPLPHQQSLQRHPFLPVLTGCSRDVSVFTWGVFLWAALMNTIDWVTSGTNVYYSQLWRPGVQGQGVGRLGLVESPLPGSQMVEGLRELSVASFTRLLNTSPRSCLHRSPIGDCSNMRIWGRYKHSVYSIKIPVISDWGPTDSTMTIS